MKKPYKHFTKTEIKIKILKEKQSAYLHIVITGGKTKNR